MNKHSSNGTLTARPCRMSVLDHVISVQRDSDMDFVVSVCVSVGVFHKDERGSFEVM